MDQRALSDTSSNLLNMGAWSASFMDVLIATHLHSNQSKADLFYPFIFINA
jgi:hypothetical protein